MSRLVVSLRFAATLVFAGGLASACSAEKKPVGGLMLLVREETSGSVDEVRVTVGRGAAPLFDGHYRIPSEIVLPTTLAIASNGQATAQATLAVSGLRGGVAVDRRDNLVEQIPTDRVVTLTVVLSPRCTPRVTTSADGRAVSSCPDGETCSPASGACVSGRVNASTLPTFDPTAPLEAAPPSATCDGGTCPTTCPAGQKICSGQCVSIDDPAFGCGAATCDATPCPSGAGLRVCDQQVCTLVARCPDEKKVCDDVCVPRDALHACDDPTSCRPCGTNEKCLPKDASTQVRVCACVDDQAACTGAMCGTAVNNCGATVSCGTCPAGSICGIGGANTCGYPPSCVAAGQTTSGCRNDTEGCCVSPLVPATTFLRQNISTASATVSAFRLDKYEATVGRFRSFVTASIGGWRPPAGSGRHAHVGATGLSGETGWLPAWDANLPSDASTFNGQVGGKPAATWTPTVSNTERLPMTYVSWYEAYAFCIWDGGFLPTEAEWQLAAVGGTDQRTYPWGAVLPSGSFANYCVTGAGCVGPTASPGSFAPGDGRYGHADLAGNVAEWLLDSRNTSALKSPCVDCVDLTPAALRVNVGGSFESTAPALANASSYGYASPTIRGFFGVRCARKP